MPHLYIRIHTHIHTHNIYMHAYIHTYTHNIYMHAYIHTYTHIHTVTHIIIIYMHACIHTHMHIGVGQYKLYVYTQFLYLPYFHEVVFSCTLPHQTFHDKALVCRLLPQHSHVSITANCKTIECSKRSR